MVEELQSNDHIGHDVCHSDSTQIQHYDREISSCWSLSGSAVVPIPTNGVNTNGPAAKVMSFDRSGKTLRPGTFGKIKVG